MPNFFKLVGWNLHIIVDSIASHLALTLFIWLRHIILTCLSSYFRGTFNLKSLNAKEKQH